MAAAIQPMDATTLRAVLAELRPALLPSRFEKAQQSDAGTVQLGLRSLGGSHWLELSWQAEAPRLLAIPPPPRGGEGSTLAQQLQHGLRGLALVGLEQPGWERVVELAFSRRPGEEPSRWLVLELMGRHSNLFLLDEQRRVIAPGRRVRQEQSRLRPIGSGDPYRPPPPMAGEPPRSDEPEETWRRRLELLPLPLGRALRDAYQGVGPALCRQLLAGVADPGAQGETVSALLEREVSALEPCHWQRLRRQWQAWLEAVEQERFRLRWGGVSDYRCWLPAGEADPDPAGGADGGGAEPLAINRALAAYYGGRLAERRLAQRRSSLQQQLRAELEREQRAIDRQQASLEAAGGSEELQRRADALLCRRAPGREEIEEAQSLYRQARRLRRSVAAIEPRLALQRQRRAWLEDSLTFLEQADSLEQLEALEQELGQEPAARRRQRGRGPRPGRRPGDADPSPLELRSPGGLRLQVGRNHRQNEWISLRQARRGDLWFHAQECPGSHVVLKASEGMAGEPDLAAAADLAAHFSRARGNVRVPVVMVAAEELQRIPGAGPGTVRHPGGTVLWGEPDRGAALLGLPNLAAGGVP